MMRYFINIKYFLYAQEIIYDGGYMGLVKTNNWMGRLEEMWTQLEESWPKTMDKILNEFPHGSKDFYIYTFFKWDLSIIPATYKVYHQPRWSIPDAFPGTVLRKVSPTRGCAEIIWALPHQEGFKLYKEGKLFGDPVVDESIRRYLNGTLDKMTEDQEDFQKV